MKNLSRLVLVALLVLVTVNVNSQDKNNPWQITVGVNAVDALATGNQLGNEDLSRLWEIGDEWNVSSAVSMITVGKYLDDNFSFSVSGTVNQLDKWNYGSASDVATSLDDKLSYYGLDGMVKYSFSELISQLSQQ